MDDIVFFLNDLLMDITWLGGSSFRLKSDNSICLLNPDKKADLSKANVVIYDTSDDAHKPQELGLMVDWPGEYDIAGFAFRGFENNGKKGAGVTAYTFHSPDGNLAWMGEMSEYPSDEYLETLGEVHVLILPIGGDDVLSAKDAFKLVEALEPMTVIPMCYGDKRDDIKAFLKEMDVKMPEAAKKFVMKRNALANESQMDLVILEAV